MLREGLITQNIKSSYLIRINLLEKYMDLPVVNTSSLSEGV